MGRFLFSDPSYYTDSMSSKSLLQSYTHLRGPDAYFLHACNVAISTAAQTGRPVDEYMTRCLSRGDRVINKVRLNPTSHSNKLAKNSRCSSFPLDAKANQGTPPGVTHPGSPNQQDPEKPTELGLTL